jgi:D-arabinose 1-dehydrogenase-like Zn-dependent alcohol dehydrogenase
MHIMSKMKAVQVTKAGGPFEVVERAIPKAGESQVRVAAPHDPIPVSGFGLLSGKTIAGSPSGTAIDSEETLAFSKLTGVRPRIEKFKLEQAEEAFARVMENKVRFRAVLVP